MRGGGGGPAAHSNFSCRYEVRRCRSELDLCGAAAARPARPPHAHPPECATRLSRIAAVARLFVAAVAVLLFSPQPLPVLRWHEPWRAAVRRLPAALFAARAAAVYVREAGCLTGTVPAAAPQLLRPRAVPALLRPARAAPERTGRAQPGLPGRRAAMLCAPHGGAGRWLLGNRLK